MALTTAEIRDRTAQESGILAIGQALNATDAARIEQAYSEVYKELKEDGLAFWSVSGTIPDQFVPWVIPLIADNIKNTYSIPQERWVRIQEKLTKAKFKISAIGSVPYESTTEVTPY